MLVFEIVTKAMVLTLTAVMLVFVLGYLCPEEEDVP